MEAERAQVKALAKEWKEKVKVQGDDIFTAAMQEATMQPKLKFKEKQAMFEAQF